MKRIALLSVIAFSLLLATACGSSAPTAAPVSSPVEQTVATSVPAATDTPVAQVPTSAPVVASDTPAASTDNTVVNVTLADYTIDSSQTTFKAGVKYTFVITNAGHHAHNFNIAQPVSVAGSLGDAIMSALLSVDEDNFPVGAVVTKEYTFPDSAVGQQLEFSCLIKKHYEDGMKLAITVTK